ncbi:MAG: sel1 repeat family protein [Victivallales bacterium]|nr:sel1 repeat family protein [Victivallales bacterium]
MVLLCKRDGGNNTPDGDDVLSRNFQKGLAYLDGIGVEKDIKKGRALIEDAANHGLLEAARKMSQMYLNGQSVERDSEKAIHWQKRYRDLCRGECSDPLDERVTSLIVAEKELAEMELEDNRIKDARNTCWRALRYCRTDDGRGEFYSDHRIPYYADVYMLLGDVFLKRQDMKQAVECYTKDLSIYMGLIETYPDNPEILLGMCRCFFKCEKVNSHLGDHYYDIVEKCLKKILEIQCDISAYRMLGMLCIEFGNRMGFTQGLEYYSKAVEIFETIIKSEQTDEAFSMLVNAYLKLGEYYLLSNNEPQCRHYNEKAEAKCYESRIKLGIETKRNLVDFIRVYCQDARRLRRFHAIQSEKMNMNFLYSEAQDAARRLLNQFPCEESRWESALLNMHFLGLCSDAHLLEAFKTLRELVNKNPIERYDEYRQFKHAVCSSTSLKKYLYSDYVCFHVESTERRDGRFQLYCKSENMRINMTIVADIPDGDVEKVFIVEDFILGMRKENSGKECKFLSCGSIQICKATDKELSPFTRKNLLPEEDVQLYIRGNDGKVNCVHYVQCYG